MMDSLRDDIRTATGVNWWIPPAPAFVSPFANPLPALTADVLALVLRSGQIDTTLAPADFNARAATWTGGLAGRAWRLETGREAVPEGPGRPYYTQLVAVPAAVNTAAQEARVNAAWARRLADTDAAHGRLTEEATTALRTCDNTQLPAGILQRADFQGLEMAFDYPVTVGTRVITRLNVMTLIQPTVELIFTTIRELGWNDLLFQTSGAGCFRGVKLRRDPADPNRHRRAARRISDHSFGLAMDFNAFENGQVAARPSGSMDPRIVLLFETFLFQWGRCFPQPDPMHFQYCGAAC